MALAEARVGTNTKPPETHIEQLGAPSRQGFAVDYPILCTRGVCSHMRCVLRLRPSRTYMIYPLLQAEVTLMHHCHQSWEHHSLLELDVSKQTPKRPEDNTSRLLSSLLLGDVSMLMQPDPMLAGFP